MGMIAGNRNHGSLSCPPLIPDVVFNLLKASSIRAGLAFYRLLALVLFAQTKDDSVERSPENHWPEFRGPLGNGVSTSVLTPPLRWSEQENVLWKIASEGLGWSTPAVWGETAWYTAASEDGSRMWAVAIALADGSTRWKTDIFENEKVDEKHSMNSFASPSPVTDGMHVWVSFGSYGTACLNANDGNIVWQRRDLPCNHWRGPGSSPILVDNKLLLHLDGFDYQYIIALDQKSGETIWRVDRNVDYGTDNGDIFKAFSTPLLIEVAGRRQLISSTSKAVLAYDPNNGNEIWRVRFDEFSATARPLWDGKLVYINTGFGKAQLYAIDPDGAGDITDTHVRWINNTSVGSKASQLYLDGLIYNVHDQGVATCIDAVDGETLWKERLGGQFSASIIAAGGYVYLFDHDGVGRVIKAGRDYQLVAENNLDDGCMASPVPIGDRLLLRTRSAIYLIGH